MALNPLELPPLKFEDTEELVFADLPELDFSQAGPPEKKKETPRDEFMDLLGPLREFATGASWGSVDEIQALLGTALGGDTFERELQTIKEEREEYKEENPWLSLGLEVLGGLTTGGLVARAVGLGGTMLTSAMRQAGAAATEAGIYGFMSGDELSERLRLAGISSLIGGPLGAAGGAVGHALSPAGVQARADKALAKLRTQVQKMDPADRKSVIEQRMYQTALERRIQSGETGLEVAQWDLPKSPLKFAQEVGAEIGIPESVVTKEAQKLGGFPDMSKMSPDELAKGAQGWVGPTPRQAAAMAKRPGGSVKVAFDTTFAPIKRMITNKVSPEVANYTNRAMNRALMQAGEFHDRFNGTLQPLRKFLDKTDESSRFLKEKLLNAALDSEEDYADALNFIRSRPELGDKVADALDDYMDVTWEWAKRYQKSVDNDMPASRLWLHTQKIAEKDEGLLRAAIAPNTRTDIAHMRRTRDLTTFEKDPMAVHSYENPIRTMDDWIDDHAAEINLSELMRLRPAHNLRMLKGEKGEKLRKIINERGEDPEKWTKKQRTFYAKLHKEDRAKFQGARGGYVGHAVRERLLDQGYSEVQADNALELLHSALYDSQRAPTAILRAIRDVGYSGSIFNPSGAAINLHDVFNAASAMGVRNALRALVTSPQIRVQDIGISPQVAGEYVKRVGSMKPSQFDKWADVTSDFGMKFAKWSGFRKLDALGKEKVMQMALGEARKEILKGGFDKRWQYTFNAAERMQLKNDLAKGEVTDLVKELAMFRLSQVQPINALQQTKFALNNPNSRILYMLKNFAIRQLDFIREEGVEAWKAGDKAKAMRFFGKYALYSGGGYALLNEARQPLAGRDPNFNPEHLTKMAGRQLASVMLMGIPGTSDYAWEKFWQNPVQAFAEGLLPPLTLMEATWSDIHAMFDPDEEVSFETLKHLPVVGKTFFTPLLDDNG